MWLLAVPHIHALGSAGTSMLVGDPILHSLSLIVTLLKSLISSFQNFNAPTTLSAAKTQG